MTFVEQLRRRRVPTASDFTEEILRDPTIKTALDIGCGRRSYLTPFRPRVRTIGLDAFEGAVETARRNSVHDEYIVADIMEVKTSELLMRNEGRKFGVVALFDVLEHLPKRLGFQLLEKCEELTEAYVLLQTPYGFVEQGPEFGNLYQRHLSGWFPHDLEGLGYRTGGCAGTRVFIGYGGRFKWPIPGIKFYDLALGFALNLRKHPRHALNFMAWKDVRGVPARL